WYDGGFGRQLEPNLGASRFDPAHLCVSAMPGHPADDRLPDAEPVGRNVVGVEAVAAIPYERADAFRARLDVGRHRRPAMAYGVEQSLAHCLHEGPRRLVGRAVAHDDQVDGYAVAVLDLGHHAAHRSL